MRSVFLSVLTLGLVAAQGQTAKQASSGDADEFLRAGIAAEQHGDVRSAIEDFQKALAIEPGLVQARVGLGVALADTGKFDAAIEEDLHALPAAADKNAVRMNLGMAYYKKGDLAHAREQLETVHAAAPRDVSPAVLLSYVYVKMGREAEAVDLLMPLEAGNESNTDLEYALAFSLIQSGRDKDGVPRMEKVAQATHSANAYFIAGATHVARQEMSDARTDLDAARHLDGSIPGLPTFIGQAEYALGDMKAAAADFQTALRADPRDFNANLDLGAIRLKERDFENARPLLELAVELQPASPIARLELGKLNEITGKYAEAAAGLEALVKAEPEWMDAHWELANTYFLLDRPEDGKRERMIAQQLKSSHRAQGTDDKKD